MKVGEIEVRKRGKGGWRQSAAQSGTSGGMVVAQEEEEEYKEKEREREQSGGKDRGREWRKSVVVSHVRSSNGDVLGIATRESERRRTWPTL